MQNAKRNAGFVHMGSCHKQTYLLGDCQSSAQVSLLWEALQIGHGNRAVFVLAQRAHSQDAIKDDPIVTVYLSMIECLKPQAASTVRIRVSRT